MNPLWIFLPLAMIFVNEWVYLRYGPRPAFIMWCGNVALTFIIFSKVLAG